ncbi:MAG: SDR family oxidoreductase [Candidatus Dadabacteria bacterium]|nr:SDR family oxidoreductase [Candidatus Dadabacteria bacterium]
MGKAALITGGGLRLGKAMALTLAEMGYDIALHYNRSRDESERAADEIKTLGSECEIFQANLLDMEEIDTLVPRVFDVFPECSVLINSASVFEDVPFHDVTEESFDRDMTVNFKAPFFLSQGFSKEPASELIVNMLDSRISKNETDHFVYNISKKALRDLTLMAAKALGPKVRVNGICPGPVLPPPGKSEDYLIRISGDTPIGKPGSPDYITAALKYIIENTYITGECLFVDGGQHLV